MRFFVTGILDNCSDETNAHTQATEILTPVNAFIFPIGWTLIQERIFFCPANLNSSYEAESFRLLVSGRN